MKVQGEPVDVVGPKIVQIMLRDDKKVLWVNVDGVCLFRACRIEKVTFEGPKPDEGMSKRPGNDSVALIIGAEFGYRCHEKGMNLQAMLEKLDAVILGKEVVENGSTDREGASRT